MIDYNKIREKFRPETIRLLFIAESPPVGNTFFYLHNSNLYRAVRKAFEEVFGQFENDACFLQFFKASGCYLDDICLRPVNHLTAKDRKVQRNAGIGPLSRRIQEANPEAIVILMKAIDAPVRKAIDFAAPPALDLVVTTSFPAHSELNVRSCISSTVEVLKAIWMRTDE